MSSRRTISLSVLSIALAALSLQGLTANAAAAETQIPGARISLDDGFVYDMNASGDYVVAWSPDDGNKYTKVLLGSALTGPIHTWNVSSGFSSTPDVAIAANGTMALSWTDSSSGRNAEKRIKYGAVWNASAARITPHILNISRSDIFDDVGRVDLAINDSGSAAFTWVSGFKGQRIGFAIGRPDGSFTSSQTVYKNHRAGFLGNPQASLDNAGSVTLRWDYLGLNCRDGWFAPKRCRNQPSSLETAAASSNLSFAPPQVFGKGCIWSQSDSTTSGQIFAVALCRAGFKYTSATTGRAFSALQNLDVLAGNRTTSSPDVKILDDGRVIVAYESLRYNGRVGPYAQIGGSIGAFGSVLGPPLAFTAEVDHTDSENQGGYFGNEPTIVEGPGSQPYIAVIGDSTNTIAALDHSGKLGQAQPLTLSAFPDSVDAKLGIAPGGVGFSIYSKEQGDTARTSRVTLWTSSFSVPSP